MHGITITYENEVLAVTLPSLLPKRRQRQSAEFLLDPLYFALEQYAKENTLPHYRECVVCFAQVYDQALPTRRVRDYDNLEEMQILAGRAGLHDDFRHGEAPLSRLACRA